MMKIQPIKTTMVLAMIVLGMGNLYAQEEPVDKTFILDPAQFIPADTGYFIVGADVDKNDDGTPEHYDGCYDAYGDDDHREAGTQHGWTYSGAIIFRNCSSDPTENDDVVKGTPPTEDWPATADLIQLTKHKYIGTDSADLRGYIISPSFSNLKSLKVRVATDLSTNGRQIFMMMEISTDGGETWSFADQTGEGFVHYQVLNQGGDVVYYEAGQDAGFDDMIETSQNSTTLLRVSPHSALFQENGQGERLKIYGIEIEATTPVDGGGGGGGPLAIGPDPLVKPFLIKDHAFIANPGEKLYVYNLSGGLIGTGSSVCIPAKRGLFVVKTSKGITQKVFIK